MGDRANWPLEHYQTKFLNIALSLLALWLAVMLVPVATTSRWFQERIVGKATPGALGAIRMFVCLIAVHQAWHDGTMRAVNLVAEGRPRVSMGVMNFVYSLGFERVISDANFLVAFKATAMTMLVLAAVGLFTRYTLVIGTVMYVVMMGIIRSYYWFNHTGVVPMYVLGVLCFTRCADGFSLDRFIRIWRQKPVHDKDEATYYYGWARWAAWAAICVPYALAGFSKMGNTGGMWWNGVNLMAMIYRNALRPIAESGDHVIAYNWVPVWAFTLVGLATIVTEVGMLSILFSRWARLVLPIGVLGMHIGILYTMTIPFYDLMLIQLVFFNWRWIRQTIARGIEASKGHWILLYDGYCPLCRRSVAILDGIDLFERLSFVSFRGVKFDEFNATHRTNITKEQADREMYLVGRDGRAYAGYDAYRRMALFLPLLWPAVPFLWIPGISHAGRAIYGWVARNRLSFFQCTDDCELKPGLINMVPAEPPTRLHRGWQWAIGLAPFFLVALWVNRIEFYPLSCFQMFTHDDDAYDASGKVVYYRIYALDTNGKFAEAYPEKLGYHHFRYWADVAGAFRFPVIKERTTDWLRNVGEKWNTQLAPADAPRIVRFEIQQREWDFLRDRDNPNRGYVKEKIEVEVPSGVRMAASQTERAAANP
jgi:predicted DCC family thiol-disulfide oxidoreductase YuxK